MIMADHHGKMKQEVYAILDERAQLLMFTVPWHKGARKRDGFLDW